MKIALTGSSGLLGKEMIKSLEKLKIKYVPFKCRFNSIDLITRDISASDFSHIFHFGAYKPKSSCIDLNEKIFFEENVLNTVNLAKLAIKKNIKFVFISTADIYPKKGDSFRENGKFKIQNDSILGGQYGLSKYHAECEISKLQINFIIFRCSTIYNPLHPHEVTFAKDLVNIDKVSKFKIHSPHIFLNLIRSDYLCQDILKIALTKSIKRKIFNYTSSKWLSPLKIMQTYTNFYKLPQPKNEINQKLILKRFNGSNEFLKSILKNNYQESIYLDDLNNWLINNNHYWYNK